MSVQNISVITGLLLPAIISFIKQEHFPNTWNAVIAVLVYVVVGVGAVLVSNQAFDLNNIVPSVGIFVAAGTVAYQAFWKNFEGDTTTTDPPAV